MVILHFLFSDSNTFFPSSLSVDPASYFTNKTETNRRKRQCSPATTSVPGSLPSIWHCGRTVCASSQGELLHVTSRSQPLSLTQGFCSGNSPLSPLSLNMFSFGFSTWWHKYAFISPFLKKNKRKKETPLIPHFPFHSSISLYSQTLWKTWIYSPAQISLLL